jgi:hypothetical protein
MSIAADASWLFPKLRRSGMFPRRFMESLVSLCACIVTMKVLNFRIPMFAHSFIRSALRLPFLLFVIFALLSVASVPFS